MRKILIFSGTTEGRILANRLADAGCLVEVCVATEYGKSMMEETSRIKVHTGRLDEEKMESFIKENGYDVIADATHPFATIVTENIISVCKKLDIAYIRIEREISSEENNSLFSFFDTTDECVTKLKNTSGNILLTTGSKELKLFCEDEKLKERIYARILPGLESIKIAYDCGLEGKQIIAMHGPFSKSMNENLLKEYNISCLVTKESGKVGGMEEKLEACIAQNVQCFIIRKPNQNISNEVYSVDEAFRKLISPVNKVNLTLIGIGMGAKNGLTINAKEAIDNADIVFGAKRMLEIVDEEKPKLPYYLEKDIMPVLIEKSLDKAINAVVLFSGDTGFYSGCEKMYKSCQQYENVEARIIPGASSLSYFSSKLGISWQDAKIVSTHGVDKNQWMTNLLEAVRENEKTFFITSGAKDIVSIGELLEKNYPDVTVHLGFELSYPDEEIRTVTLEECKSISKEGLYVGMIINEACTGKVMTPGISDDEFIRDKVPMTKEEVRVLSICKLGLKKDSVVFDVGSGTGSIAIEMALLSKAMQVYAIEINDLALDLIAKNCEKFGVKNVSIIKALAPEGFEKLPTPTHAFIGGSKGNLKEIICTLKQMNPYITIVINAVSLETLTDIQRTIKELNIENADITCVNISKARKLGDYNLMQAANPVYIVKIF